MKKFYFYRNEMIERFGPGWVWTEEMCRGNNTGNIYKTIEDTKTAIREYLDSTHKSEPRVIGTWEWLESEHDWIVK